MGSIGFQELAVIALIALFVFGPERLPELAREAGKFIARFRSETSKSIDELKRAADVQDLDRELREMRSQLRSLGRELTSGLEGADGGDPVTTTGDAVAVPRQEPPPVDPEAT